MDGNIQALNTNTCETPLTVKTKNRSGTPHVVDYNAWCERLITMYGDKKSIWWFFVKMLILIGWCTVVDVIQLYFDIPFKYDVALICAYIPILMCAIFWKMYHENHVLAITTTHPTNEKLRWKIYSKKAYATGGFALFCIIPECGCGHLHMHPSLITETPRSPNPHHHNLSAVRKDTKLNPLYQGWARSKVKRRSAFMRRKLVAGIGSWFYEAGASGSTDYQHSLADNIRKEVVNDLKQRNEEYQLKALEKLTVAANPLYDVVDLDSD